MQAMQHKHIAPSGDISSLIQINERLRTKNEKPRRKGRGLRSSPRTSGEPIVTHETSGES
jgi:hypothetical protein